MHNRNRERHPVAGRQSPKRSGYRLPLAALLLIVAVVAYGSFHKSAVINTSKVTSNSTATAAPKTALATKSTPKACSDNTDKNVIVSISQRHMWVCDGPAQMYDSAVVTGMEKLPADLTPVGTYHISAKYTDRYLRGSDSTGSWNDYVHYWLPWLHNQYGNYGFHDATWRNPAAFGNIDPNSADASHGCVELPLAAAAWLYNWSSVGTTVTIKA